MPSCTCVLDIMWDMHANGGVLIMVGLGIRAILRCKGAETVSFAPKLTWAWVFWGVLQIFSGYSLLQLCCIHHIGLACRWRGANNGGVGRTSQFKM